MQLIQVILILGVVLSAVMLVRGLSGEKSLAMKRLFALVGVILAVLAIMFPHWVTVIARLVGIGRGTDLLLYLFIIGALVFAVSVIRAKARSDARVTRLARAVALMEARLTEHNGRLPSSPLNANDPPETEDHGRSIS